MEEIYVIAIAGGTGSGKTTVAQGLIRHIGSERVVFIQHDNYYRDQSEFKLEDRLKTNYDHPRSLETDLLIKHLQLLKSGKPVEMPLYDFTTHTRSSEIKLLHPRPVIILEGILLFVEKRLRELCDLKVFVDTPDDVRLIRRLTRDMTERGRNVESVITQYTQTVRPMHQQFVEPSKLFADIIIPEGGHNMAAIDVLTAKVTQILS